MLNEGSTIEEVARQFQITDTTWYRWKNQYGGMKANDAKQLKVRFQVDNATKPSSTSEGCYSQLLAGGRCSDVGPSSRYRLS